MVLVKKKKIETKPVDDELEKKKKMLAYTQGKLAPNLFYLTNSENSEISYVLTEQIFQHCEKRWKNLKRRNF